MKRLQWELVQLQRKLGSQGLLGLVLILLSIGVFLFKISPTKEALFKAQHSVQAETPSLITSKAKTPDYDINKFYDGFPATREISQQMRAIHKVAESKNVEFDKIEYKLSKVPGTSLSAYKISCSIFVNYKTMRNFISQLLKENPNLALEQVEINRENVKSNEIETKIDLVTYYKQSDKIDERKP